MCFHNASIEELIGTGGSYFGVWLFVYCSGCLSSLKTSQEDNSGHTGSHKKSK